MLYLLTMPDGQEPQWFRSIAEAKKARKEAARTMESDGRDTLQITRFDLVKMPLQRLLVLILNCGSVTAKEMTDIRDESGDPIIKGTAEIAGPWTTGV